MGFTIVRYNITYFVNEILQHGRSLDQPEQAKCLKIGEIIAIIEGLDDIQRAADAENQLELVDAPFDVGLEAVTDNFHQALDIEQHREATLQSPVQIQTFTH